MPTSLFYLDLKCTKMIQEEERSETLDYISDIRLIFKARGNFVNDLPTVRKDANGSRLRNRY